MNDLIRKMALDAHLLNYIDLETPRYYFISGNAEEEDLHNFAYAIIQECCKVIINGGYQSRAFGEKLIQLTPQEITKMIESHFRTKD